MYNKRKQKAYSSHKSLLAELLDGLFDILSFKIQSLFKGLFRKNQPDQTILRNSQINHTIAYPAQDVADIRHQFGEVCITKRGETVKSKGEKEIADFLYKHNVNYEYEKPVTRPDGGVNRPDFYLNDYNVYIEYYGMHGDPKYNYETNLKKETYQQMNLQVIELWPKNVHSKGNLGWMLKKKFEETTGWQFPATSEIKYYNYSKNPATKA